ncbi:MULTISPECIES: TraK family protein [Acidiphilium]|uniref:TraK family protein n=1 Tax=Acidiphilium TaxID=522 RepID=UPI00130DFA2A|nr:MULTISPECIES: TraK family protein [Acidiphilium]
MQNSSNASKRRGNGRVAFLARREQFEKLLVAGHTQISLYECHANELGVTYSQFSRYVRTYILKDRLSLMPHSTAPQSTLTPLVKAVPPIQPNMQSSARQPHTKPAFVPSPTGSGFDAFFGRK